MAKKNTKQSNGGEKHIVVIGASAGGNKAILQLTGQLQQPNAAYFIVIHITNTEANKLFVNRLQKATPLPCHIANSSMSIEMGHIYLAPADTHMFIKNDKILLGHGPPENRHRPSIDVLFRSAAASWDSAVTGIILTGLLTDGVAGMSAIHRSGGTCIVQDPAEAEYQDMPKAVLKAMQPDYCLTINKMGSALDTIMKNPEPFNTSNIPSDVKTEASLTERAITRINEMDELGKQTIYTCPNCGGSLWEIDNDGVTRFRCFTGYAYNEKDLIQKQEEKIEDTLWTALRMMEEKKNLSLKLEASYRAKGFTVMAVFNRDRAKEMDVHINRLRYILINNETDKSHPH